MQCIVNLPTKQTVTCSNGFEAGQVTCVAASHAVMQDDHALTSVGFSKAEASL